MLGLGFGISSGSGRRPWAPTDEATCTLFAQRPNYSATAGNGTWTATTGSNLSHATTAPSASSGEPLFASASSHHLDSASNVSSILSTTEGTIAMVVKPTAHPADTSVFNNKLFFANAGFASIGMSLVDDAGTDKYSAHVYDGLGYQRVLVAATYNTFRSVIMRFSNNGLLELMVDGRKNDGSAGWQTTAIGPWTQTGGVLTIGTNHNGTVFFDGTVRAIFTASTKLSDTFADNWNAYARANFGTT